jgi:hypothetical protein
MTRRKRIILGVLLMIVAAAVIVPMYALFLEFIFLGGHVGFQHAG